MPAIKKPSDHFHIALQTETGAAADFPMPNGMAPDFGWLKSRSTGSTNHLLTNRLVNNGNTVSTNSTTAEFSNPALYFNGNNMGMQPYNSDAGQNGQTYVLWGWKAGGGTAVTNTSGTISSQVSANPTAGFSIVTYTGTGANATVGHGLGVTPSMVIVKARSTTGNWCVTMPTLGANNVPFLDLTNAAASFPTVFNGLPTSTIFNIGTAGSTNTNAATFVAYCFAAVEGYSAFGSYTGNGSADGPFVFTGFRPRFVLFKKSSAADDWIIYDTSRDTYNVASKNLYPNGAFAEDTNTANRAADILSNGFKIRSSATYLNLNAATFIYMAFAEAPFKFANAR